MQLLISFNVGRMLVSLALIRGAERMTSTWRKPSDRPNEANAKYSGAEKRRAKLARIGAKKAKHSAVKVPPTPEEIVAMPMALPASPFCAMGYPSKTVAAAAGVPGVLIRIEAMPPP